MFDSENGDFDIQKKHINGKGEYVVTAGLTNNGILGNTDSKAKIFNENTITIDMFGNSFFRHFRYKMVTHARVFSLIPKININEKQGLYIVSAFKFLSSKFGYENMCSWSKIKAEYLQLPTKNGEIDFDFMESLISELEEERISELDAYLTVSEFVNYELTNDELQAVQDFSNGKVTFGKFEYQYVFNKIVQGRRLKKDDHKKGSIPFVMSGTTNTGVVGYISNPVAKFPSNSITLDIFGNAFYRPYEFGAGDDTGVYWNTENVYSKLTMLFFATAMEKSVRGKFSYGKKLRSSQSLNFMMDLPQKDGEMDIVMMENLITAVQKLVIKDVVLYADKKINATKHVIKNKRYN